MALGQQVRGGAVQNHVLHSWQQATHKGAQEVETRVY